MSAKRQHKQTTGGHSVSRVSPYSRLTDCRSAAELRREDSLATLTAFVWVAAVIYKMLPPHGHCRNIYFL